MEPSTQEYAKNPDPVLNIQCQQCGKQSLLSEILRERRLEPPHADVQEVYMLCPHCQEQTHSFYLPDSLHHAQLMLKKAVMRWNRTQKIQDYEEFERRQKAFQRNFDNTQEKYRRIFQEEMSHEQVGDR
jgi:hypothetical protein